MLNTKRLKEIDKPINLKHICTLAGLKYQTIYAKLTKGKNLTEEQAQKLTDALASYGIRVDEKAPANN